MSKNAQFLDSLHTELVLAEGRLMSADANEDAYSSSAESGYLAGIQKSIDLFRSIVLEVS